MKGTVRQRQSKHLYTLGHLIAGGANRGQRDIDRDTETGGKGNKTERQKDRQRNKKEKYRMTKRDNEEAFTQGFLIAGCVTRVKDRHRQKTWTERHG